MKSVRQVTDNTRSVVPKSLPIRMPPISSPAPSASGRRPFRLRSRAKVRRLSEQYFATKSATAIFANSDGCRLSSSPGNRMRIHRLAPLMAGKKSTAIISSTKQIPIHQ